MSAYVSWLGKNAVLFDPQQRMNPYQMTAAEQREWWYRKEERLGILCGSDEPTAEQVEIAQGEANRWLKLSRSELL